MILSLLLSIASADEVARVLIVEPGAVVELDGERRPLGPMDRLDEQARIFTDDTGILILQLHNDHLVRIESELELPVDRLAMLKGPRSKRTVSEQLTDLLYDDERERLGAMVTSAEGIGGWHGRLTAAASPDGVHISPEDAHPGGPSIVSPRPAPRPSTPPRRGDPKAGSDGERDVVPNRWPEIAAHYQPDGALAECVSSWSTDLGVHILTEKLTIEPVVRDGKVARLKVQGAFPIPRCLRDGLVDKPAPDDAEAITIRLP